MRLKGDIGGTTTYDDVRRELPHDHFRAQQSVFIDKGIFILLFFKLNLLIFMHFVRFEDILKFF